MDPSTGTLARILVGVLVPTLGKAHGIPHNGTGRAGSAPYLTGAVPEAQTNKLSCVPDTHPGYGVGTRQLPHL